MTEQAEKELVNTVHSLIQNNLRYEVLIRALVEGLGKKTLADGSPILTIDELNVLAEEIKKQIIASGQAQAEAAAKAAGATVPPNV